MRFPGLSRARSPGSPLNENVEDQTILKFMLKNAAFQQFQRRSHGVLFKSYPLRGYT